MTGKVVLSRSAILQIWTMCDLSARSPAPGLFHVGTAALALAPNPAEGVLCGTKTMISLVDISST